MAEGGGRGGADFVDRGCVGGGRSGGVDGYRRWCGEGGLRGFADLVRRRFAGRRATETVLVEHEKAPQVWQAPLSAELAAVGADTDAQIIAAAQRVMALVDEAGSASGKYLVDLRGAQGVQVGDHNTQTNTFTAPLNG